MSDFKTWYKQQNSPDDTEGSSLPLFNTLQSSATSSFTQLQTSLTPASTPPVLFGLDYATRFRLFICLLSLSVLFFALGFLVGLPALALRPQKFALCFTFGSLTFMGSFSMLAGPAAHCKSMFQSDRLAFTAVYFSTTIATLYFTFSYGGISGYVFVLSATVIQLLALLWYLVTFIPGGSRGLAVVTAAVSKLVQPIVSACTTCGGLCIRKCLGA